MIYYFPNDVLHETDLCTDYSLDQKQVKIDIPNECTACNLKFEYAIVGDVNTETILKQHCHHILSYKMLWSFRIKENIIKLIDSMNDGCKCDKCYDWVSMAVSNMPDNKFRCYRCRSHPLLTY